RGRRAGAGAAPSLPEGGAAGADRPRSDDRRRGHPAARQGQQWAPRDLGRIAQSQCRGRGRLHAHRSRLSAGSPTMVIQHASPNVSEVLERVLDKGIVIDARVHVMVVGIDLVTIDARVVVASLETYFRYAGALDDERRRP